MFVYTSFKKEIIDDFLAENFGVRRDITDERVLCG
jgi:hypothetical protein